MSTIVNNPTPSSESGGTGLLIGILVIIGFTIFLIYFGIPMIRNLRTNQINVPSPQIVLPDKIDINVRQTK